MSHRSGATALRTETVAILNSPLIRREPILHRGHILHPAAVTPRRRARIPLLLAAVTAAEAAMEARRVAIAVGEALPAMAGAVVVMAVVEEVVATEAVEEEEATMEVEEVEVLAAATLVEVAAEARTVEAAEVEVRTVEAVATRIANWHLAAHR